MSNNLIEIAQIIEESSKAPLNAQGKDIVAVIGGVGSGKTTTILFLLESEFEILKGIGENYEVHPKFERPDLKTSSDSIGVTQTVTTILLPSISKLYISDLPGQREPQGLKKELQFSIISYRTLQVANSVRLLVFVADEVRTCERGRLVLSNLSEIYNLFHNYEEYSSSILYILTKIAHPKEMKEVEVSTLIERANNLYNKILEQRSDMTGTNEYNILTQICQDLEKLMMIDSGDEEVEDPNTFVIHLFGGSSHRKQLLNKINNLKPITNPKEAFKFRLSRQYETELEALLSIEINEIQKYFKNRVSIDIISQKIEYIIKIITLLSEEMKMVDLKSILEYLLNFFVNENRNTFREAYDAIRLINVHGTEQLLIKMIDFDDLSQKLQKTSFHQRLKRDFKYEWKTLDDLIQKIVHENESQFPKLSHESDISSFGSLWIENISNAFQQSLLIKGIDSGKTENQIRDYISLFLSISKENINGIKIETSNNSKLGSIESSINQIVSLNQKEPCLVSDHVKDQILNETKEYFLSLIKSFSDSLGSELLSSNLNQETENSWKQRFERLNSFINSQEVCKLVDKTSHELNEEFIQPFQRVISIETIEMSEGIECMEMISNLSKNLRHLSLLESGNNKELNEKLRKKKEELLAHTKSEVDNLYQKGIKSNKNLLTKLKDSLEEISKTNQLNNSLSITLNFDFDDESIPWEHLIGLLSVDKVIGFPFCENKVLKLIQQTLKVLEIMKNLFIQLFNKKDGMRIKIFLETTQSFLSKEILLQNEELISPICKTKIFEFNSKVKDFYDVQIISQIEEYIKTFKIECIPPESTEWIPNLEKFKLFLDQMEGTLETYSKMEGLKTEVSNWLTDLENKLNLLESSLQNSESSESKSKKIIEDAKKIVQLHFECVDPYMKSKLKELTHPRNLSLHFYKFLDMFINQVESTQIVIKIVRPEEYSHVYLVLTSIEEKIRNYEHVDQNYSQRLTSIVSDLKQNMTKNIQEVLDLIKIQDFSEAQRRLPTIPDSSRKAVQEVILKELIEFLKDLENKVKRSQFEDINADIVGNIFNERNFSFQEILERKKAISDSLEKSLKESHKQLINGISRRDIDFTKHIETFLFMEKIGEKLEISTNSLSTKQICKEALKLAPELIISDAERETYLKKSEKVKIPSEKDLTEFPYLDLVNCFTTLEKITNKYELVNFHKSSFLMAGVSDPEFSYYLDQILNGHSNVMSIMSSRLIKLSTKSPEKTLEWLSKVDDNISRCQKDPSSFPKRKTLENMISKVSQSKFKTIENDLKEFRFEELFTSLEYLESEKQLKMIHEVESIILNILNSKSNSMGFNELQNPEQDLNKIYILSQFIEGVEKSNIGNEHPNFNELKKKCENNLKSLSGSCDQFKKKQIEEFENSVQKMDILKCGQQIKKILVLFASHSIKQNEKEMIIQSVNGFWKNLENLFKNSLDQIIRKSSSPQHLKNFKKKSQEFLNLSSSEQDNLKKLASNSCFDICESIQTLSSKLKDEIYNPNKLENTISEKDISLLCQICALGIEFSEFWTFDDELKVNLDVPNKIIEDYCNSLMSSNQSSLEKSNYKLLDSTFDSILILEQETRKYSYLIKISKKCNNFLFDFENWIQIRFKSSLMEIKNSNSSTDCARSIINIWNECLKSTTLQQHLTKVLEKQLSDLKSEKGFIFIHKTGSFLEIDPNGSLLIPLLPQFFSNIGLISFNKTVGQITVNHCVDRIRYFKPTGEEMLPVDEKEKLTQILSKYLTLFDQELKKCLFLSSSQSALEYSRKLVKSSVENVKNNLNSESLLDLVVSSCILFTISYSVESYFENKNEDWNLLRTPHKIQVATLLLLLEIHKPSQGLFRSILSYVLGKGTKNPSPIVNHMVQVLTGEGKSILLGILSFIFSSIGYNVDVVCYSSYLTQRDQNDLSVFFKSYPTGKEIRYMTFDQLCSLRLEGVRDAILSLILNKKLPPNFQNSFLSKKGSNEKRILLIDEVDVFLTRRFYGMIYNAGVKVKSPEIFDCCMYIYNQMKKGVTSYDIKSIPSYNNLMKKFDSSLHNLFNIILEEMKINVLEFDKPKYHSENGKIGYKNQDVIDYEIEYANKTMFAYLHEAENNPLGSGISKEFAYEQVGFTIECGQLSYAELPSPKNTRNPYLNILGTSGSISPLIKGEIDILREEYNIKTMSLSPSVYGTPKLQFNEHSDTHFHETESDWFASIARAADIYSNANSQFSVLIYFKNQRTLLDFIKNQPSFELCEKLWERTPDSKKAIVVACATQPNHVTLCTRSYGRGVDFKNAGTHKVVVIMTFLPSSEAEETQIKGRTARQGREGVLRVELCIPHLSQKFLITKEKIDEYQKKNQVWELLRDSRSLKAKSKMEARKTRKESSKFIDTNTWRTLDILFDENKPYSDRMKELSKVSMRNKICNTSYILMLDVSGSMGGSRWESLKKAYNEFVLKIKASPNASHIRCTVIFFASSAWVNSSCKASDIPPLPQNCPGGGTDFVAAFAQCKKSIENDNSEVFHLLFLTDGYAADPSQIVKELIQAYGTRISRFTCLDFGGGGEQTILQGVVKQFEYAKIQSELMSPKDTVELVEEFKKVAQGPIFK